VAVVKGEVALGLYACPSFAWVVYLKGERSLKEVKTIKANLASAEARALARKAKL